MDNQTNKTSFSELIIGFIIIAIIGAVFTLAVTYGLQNITIKNVDGSKTEEKILRKPECNGSFEEYNELIKKGQSVSLSINQPSYARDGQFIGDKRTVTRRQGEIACGYLFVSAHKGESTLDERYDSIYVNPQGLGGHLLRNRGINLSESTPGKTTMMLMLDAISYLPRAPYNPQAEDFEISNWVNLLNASRKTEFIIGLSTLDESGMIDDVRIAYKCWNPVSGKETSDCQLSVDNK